MKMKDYQAEQETLSNNELEASLPKDSYQFDSAQHIHLLNGIPLHGVTTILQVISKPQLIPWAVKMCADTILEVVNSDVDLNEVDWDTLVKEAKGAHKTKKESAADFGVAAHSFLENYIKKGEKHDLIKPFIDWAESNKVEFLECEKNVYSKNLWVGGICDFVFRMDGKLYVGDLKTSSDIYEEHFLQCGAYATCLAEMGLYWNFKGLFVFNLKKDGTHKFEIRKRVGRYKKAFRAAVVLHKHLRA